MAPTFVKAALLLSLASSTLAQTKLVTNVTALPGKWAYMGCYVDIGRTINADAYASQTAMTNEACVAYCDKGNYLYAGTEYANECYCGNSIPAQATNATSTDCSTACSGNKTEVCGGGNRLTLFYSGKTAPPPPVTNPGPTNWTSQGCYSDNVQGRALTAVNIPEGANNMTVTRCAQACWRGGFNYAGIEYMQECYCGNSIAGGNAAVAAGDCNSLCAGNSSEYCGAGNRLNVYAQKAFLATVRSSTTTTTTTTTTSRAAVATTTTAPGAVTSSTTRAASSTTTTSATAAPTLQHVPAYGNYKWIGCYTEATNARALKETQLADYANMTVEMCGAFCTPKYSMFGLEYHGECYCGNALQAGSVVAPTSECSMQCDGNKFQYCGAGNRLDVYQLNATAPSSTTTTTTRPATTTTGGVVVSTTTTTPTSAATGLPAGWKYGGCYVDGANGRIMNVQNPDSNTLTNENCVQSCISQGYTIAGMEYASQCFCDNALYNGAAKTAESDCSTPCSGNANQKCGNGGRMSVYYTGNLTNYQPPAPKKNVAGWTYQGCYSDNVNGKALFWQVQLVNNNTAENCLGLCQKYGYMSAGMEYGQECYCGDATQLAASGSTKQDEASCADKCSGDPTQICGGGNRLTYYTWTDPNPLYVWNTPQGTAQGQYKLLIGGLIVPLITTLGTNNKVTFLEKHGTGQQNQTTGAFELDLANINDFSKAWREVPGIKTDIFCSAGLTLPDKVGRQINIGGWSGDSTFGIRFYWPDGSPGVASKNGWQENFQEVSLLDSRWYPSAVTLANGSILVVGGEVGSNSAPTPTLEILPRPAGVTASTYMDWLKRTDPNNLYPFLFVLPSGGVFVAYWNEARILDERTFATTKTLPNMPGSVNNFLAGRTYPLEGTAMMLPQYAPFTDKVTIIVCGGSSAGAAYGVDNCVSTRPEDTNPTWTIERMPSQRVMSCMVALPDGTYLILNGAHQGVAGFGLGTDPNLEAVLYDPSKKVNQRMSIMAKTSVARMYHSEAILLPDGRVMVSGSDPQEPAGGNPEEYRVEQFIPPYLLNGKTPPTFTMANKDWAYGQSITINYVAPAGGPIRVSLMGAVSSTHGNSMGQRTLFPAVSCSGGSCTITAPPDAHTCPPGWFQVFVLDGPTPSTSQWVRIGGDPANLGAWPNFPDFTVPGKG